MLFRKADGTYVEIARTSYTNDTDYYIAIMMARAAK